ncbi:hypothetical protein J1N35_011125 [Gossypium stocksii]|uniref:Reverse transcriptase zinc-binding domain-containing protein n=1 Tax=Gossypium stocksii TaxID=47602 RepID=A0A9D3W2Y7_9ROSI|nr:hypothetical protein J1N35_011125 [Gossypium stocksii]
MLEEDKRLVVHELGVRCSNEPERYLGLPNMVGRRKKEAFQNLKDRIKKQIDNWSTRFLSQRGKEVFIKAILQAVPIYSMACFLLPKSLCVELESILAKYWWHQSRGKKGIYWCTWQNLCFLKENGGLGFRNLSQFNVVLLAKQGWRLISYPSSLLARVLKAKYYPRSNFLKAQLETLPSLTWKSIWAAKGLLKKGLCWRIRRGNKVSIWNDCWIQGIDSIARPYNSRNSHIELVSDLIDNTNRKWRTELVNNTFQLMVSRSILQIPLSEIEHEDFQVWGGETTGTYSVRSAYKLLQFANLDPSDYLLQTESMEFFRKLWTLKLPPKVTITIWRIAWNYIPTFGNLR